MQRCRQGRLLERGGSFKSKAATGVPVGDGTVKQKVASLGGGVQAGFPVRGSGVVENVRRSP